MANSSGAPDFSRLGIGKAITHNRLMVPPNQRDYAWREENVVRLLQDFSNAIDKGIYFLGCIVLTRSKNSESLEIADGQQRLATSSILLASIRDRLFRMGDTVLVNSIENDFLFTTIRATRENVARLTLNTNDHEFYRKRILTRPDSPDRKVRAKGESQESIDEAANLISTHIGRILKPLSPQDHISTLTKWADFIENGAQVIVLTVPDDLDAFQMFETLNDRGLRTSQADLVKNHLFREAGTKINEAQQQWATMKGALESLGIEDPTLTYLRHLTISMYGHMVTREVFEKIKNKISGRGPTISFLQKVAEHASDYVALLTQDHQKWNDYPDGIRKSVDTMNLLQPVPARPLMLSIAYKFIPKEAEKAFRLFVRWTVRLLIVGGGRSGAVEESYAACAVKVVEGKITTAKEIFTEMKRIIPNDAVFEEEFAKARVSKTFLARYYLRALELYKKRQPDPEWVPNESTVINLEHVLPQNPGVGWSNIDVDTADAYYKRLGNMALMQATKNSIIGNSKFSDKQAALKASTYFLTKEIGEESSWTQSEIDGRQKRLAQLAVKTWPIDI